LFCITRVGIDLKSGCLYHQRRDWVRKQQFV